MIKHLSVKSWLLLVLFLTSFAFLLVPKQDANEDGLPADEKFDPSLKYLVNLELCSKYIEKTYAALNKNSFDTAAYVDVASETMKKRFRYGMAEYSFGENWIAYLSGKLFWQHFAAKVDPEDILNGNIGLCSQQSIVFMHLLHQKGIRMRSVGLGFKEGPGHFLAEVGYNGEWHVYDVTKEPNWDRVGNQHRSMEYFLEHKDSLLLVYESRMKKEDVERITKKVEYGNENSLPARKMLAFHKITKYLTFILPIFFFFPSYRAIRKQYKLS